MVDLEKIEILKREAAEAGDLDTLELCQGAEAGDQAAKVACMRIIRAISDLDEDLGLYDAETEEYIREATSEDIDKSYSKEAGHTGVFLLEDRRVYVY